MYIIKNALKCIGRSKGRNILIGVIVLVIALSACVGLSIRQAAEKAKSDALENLTVTATISFDRKAMMNQMQSGAEGGEQGAQPPEQGGKFDKGGFAQAMEKASSLSLEDYQKYAKADSVKDFYYSETASLNGTDDFSPVTTETESTTSTTSSSENSSSSQKSSQTANAPAPSANMPDDRGGKMGFSSSDFQIVGYGSDSAMTSFTDGTAKIEQGSVFEENTENTDCIISNELAVFNDISVGDSIKLSNPNNESETYTLKVVGIYSDSSANENAFTGMRGGPNVDPANKIYMSYNGLNSIIAASKKSAVKTTDENTGTETSSEITGSISGTYVFADTDAYYQFEEDVRTLGLDETYTVSSPDLAAYESSLSPLNTLSTAAGWFLLVILVIGAVILIVLNIFNVRERKYEIGVLTAMGMNKIKVAAQFLTEIFIVTLAAVIIGAAAGAASSVPVTNALLENQIESQTAQTQQAQQNFGRDNNAGGMDKGGMDKGTAPNQPTNYITQVTSATNTTVILQMLGIAVILTLISGAASMLFIMRYEPLKILANRD